MVQLRPSMSMLLRPIVASSHSFPSPPASPSGRNAARLQASTNALHSDVTVDNSNSEVLLLEGDAFSVSHDGIARTGYHLGGITLAESSFPLAIEEFYDLQRAHKKFFLRQQTMGIQKHTPACSPGGLISLDMDESPAILGKQAVGIAPLGEAALGCIEIQEIDQGVFGSAGTGATTWESSIAMGLWFATNPGLLRGKVIELGCGVGFGQILAQMGLALGGKEGDAGSTASGSGVESVTLTDGNAEVLEQCLQNLRNAFAATTAEHGVALSAVLPTFQVKHLSWELADAEEERYDTIVACDVAYLHTQVEPLVHAMTSLLADDGRVHLFGPYNRGALQHVCRKLQEDESFDVNLDFIQLERYRLKPQKASRDSGAFHDAYDRNAYESTSTATFLHATARRRKMNTKQNDPPRMNDID